MDQLINDFYLIVGNVGIMKIMIHSVFGYVISSIYFMYSD